MKFYLLIFILTHLYQIRSDEYGITLASFTINGQQTSDLTKINKCTSYQDGVGCLECEFNYFIYKDKNNQICVQCPVIQEQNNLSTRNFMCLDCVNDQQQWQNSFSCTQIFSQDDQQQLIIKSSNFNFEIDTEKKALRLAQTINQQCQSSFYLSSQESLICKNCPEGCKSCQAQSSSTICSECNQGYLLQNNNCLACSSFIPNCVSCGQKNNVIFCLSCSNQVIFIIFLSSQQQGQQLIPSADLKACISCDQTESSQLQTSNCNKCSLRNTEGTQINYLNQSKTLYSSSSDNNQIQESLQYQLYCDQCQEHYYLNSYYQCTKCIQNCEICYQGSLTEDIQDSQGYYTLQYKYQKYKNDSFITKCVKCKDGYFLLKSSSQQDEQCLPNNQLAPSQVIQNCAQIVINQNSNPSCRFCINSGQKVGQNKCDISLDQYQKDTKCISFYQDDSNQNFCDLCLEGYTPTPLGCFPCKNKSRFCSQISVQSGNSNLFSLIYLQLFKKMFTKYEEQNYEGIFQINQGLADISCIDGTNPVDKKCQVLQCQQSSCSKCSQDQYGKEICEKCRDVDPLRNEQQDQIFKPSTVSRKRVKSDLLNCTICDRYCNLCVKRTQIEIQEINPYFSLNYESTQLLEYYQTFTQKCIQQRPLDQQCSQKSLDSQIQVTQSVKCSNNDINNQGVYYNPTFNRFTVCQKDQIQCKKSMKFAKVIDCSNNPKLLKLSDAYNQEEFIADPNIYKITSKITLDFSRKIVMDFSEYENIPYLTTVLNEELITNFEYIVYIIPDADNSCYIRNDFTVKSQLANKVFAVETISLKLVPLVNGQVQEDLVLNLYMSESVNIEGFTKITVQNIIMMDSQINENQVNTFFGINLSKNLFRSEVEFINVKFQKNKQATQIQGAPVLFPQSILHNIKKLTINDVVLEDWEYSKDSSPFLFDDYNPDLFLFQADINSLQITNVNFTGKTVFPIINPQAEINLSDVTLDNVKFVNSTFSNDYAIPLSNLNTKVKVKVQNLNIVSSLLDGSTLFQYQNNFLSLILNTINIDQTNKFANGKGLSLILTRQLQALNINLGCSECEDEQLDFNWYRLIMIPDLQEVQKQVQIQTPLIFSVQFVFINQSIFRQKSFLINIPFTPLKTSHLIHIVTLKNIIFSYIQCKGANCQDGLNAIYVSGVQEARINNVQMLDSVGFQLLKVSSSKIMEIQSVTCSNQNSEVYVSSMCLIVTNYYMYAKITSITVYYLEARSQPFIQISQEDPSLYSEQETKQYFDSQADLQKVIAEYFENQLQNSSVLIIENLILQDVSINLKPNFLGPTIGGLMIQNVVPNRSLVKQLNITNAQAVKEEKDIQDIIVGIYYTSTNDIVVLDQCKINGIDTEFYKMVNYINSKTIRIKNGDFRDSNSQKYWAVVKGGFFNVLTQDLLVESTIFFLSQANYGGALFISNNQKAVVNIKGPNTKFFANMAIQQGGAIYIDSQNDININISEIYADSLLANNLGGFFYMKADGETYITIEKSNFKNCFCEQGSIMNVDTELISGSINVVYDNNKFTSPKKFDTHTHFDNDTKQGAMFYLLRAKLTISNSEFYSIYFNSPLVYLFGGKYVEINNTYRDIELNNPPLVFLQQVTVQINNPGNETQVNTYKDIRLICLKENNCKVIDIQKIQFLYSIDQSYLPPEMHNLVFQDIKCNQCGLIFNTLQSKINRLYITNSTFINNQLFYSPIQVISTQQNSIRILKNKQEQYGFNLIQQQMANNFYQRNLQKKIFSDDDLNEYDLKIDKCTFQSNIVEQNGGAISIKEINIKISNVKCIGNESKNEGGCINYSTQNKFQNNKFLLENTQISKNIAQIGGGVRVTGTEAILKNFSEIKDNIAKKYGQDYLSYPMGISISLYKNGVKKELGRSYGKTVIDVDNWVTGQDEKVNGYFVIQFLDINEIQMIVPDAQVEITLDDSEFSNPSSKIDGIKSFSSNNQGSQVVLNDIVFKKQPLQNLKVKVKSSTIKYPVYDKQTGFLISYDTNFYFILNIKMRECLVGEAFFDISGECRLCDKDYYSLHKSSTQCLECPKVGVDSCDGGNKLNLQSGYWRLTDDSDLIEQCDEYSSGCLGGYLSGNQSCKQGYIGALCQSCDINGQVWGERYSKSSSYSCKSCKDFANNLIRLLALGTFVCISLFLSIRGQIDSMEAFKSKYYLKKLGFLKPGKTIMQESQVAIVIKILTTYVQIIGHLQKFQIKLPSGLNEIVQVVGNPVRQVSHSLDCQIVLTSDNIPIVYLRIIWKLFQPVFLMIISFLFYCFFSLLGKKKLKKTAAYTIILYTFIYFQPSIVQELISTMACSYISGQYYIKADYNYMCYDDIYYNWTLTLILPFFIFWCFICPFILFVKLYLNRNILQNPLFKEKFGYLYNEYRVGAFYWELFKTLIKILIVVVIEFYSSFIYIKGILAILICFIYGILLKKCKPYQDINMNQLDKQSLNACLLSLILVLFYYKNSFIYFQYITFILLVMVNLRFILKILINLMREFTIKFYQNVDKYRQRLHKYFPRLSKMLKISNVTLARKHQLWETLRSHVYIFKKNMKIIKLQQQSIDNLNLFNKFQPFNIETYKSSTPSILNRHPPLRQRSSNTQNQDIKTSIFNQKQPLTQKQEQGIEILQTSCLEIPNENPQCSEKSSKRDFVKLSQFPTNQIITTTQRLSEIINSEINIEFQKLQHQQNQSNY
ncbi:hypothetical protein ABPG74_014973 [Tetrahymena malaccensis]